MDIERKIIEWKSAQNNYVEKREAYRQAWAEESGVSAKVIRDRMEKLGWDAESAVFAPVRKCERRAA